MKLFRLLIGVLLLLFVATADCRAGDSEPPNAGTTPEGSISVESDRLPAVAATTPSAGLGINTSTSKIPEEPVRKKDGAAPILGKQATSPPLDLPSLEKRLRETNAIGVFTKITLKNQVDDLVNQFRDYHGGEAKNTLAELQQRYDMLLLKLLSLLQDSDPTLARTIVASRDAIWSILIDPGKFKTI